MAGQIALTGNLTDNHLRAFESCGFKLNVLVDCSHNANVVTYRGGDGSNEVMAKPIELDCQLNKGAAPNYVALMTGCHGASAASPLNDLYTKLAAKVGPGATIAQVAAKLEEMLTREALKLEFPSFAASIFDRTNPPYPISDAVECCDAATAVAFDALEEYKRKSMGMYQRTGTGSFTLTRGPEAAARTATPADD
ncbi:MAG: hypothetical protein ACRBCL_09340 [Maritimibacter sp.]